MEALLPVNGWQATAKCHDAARRARSPLSAWPRRG